MSAMTLKVNGRTHNVEVDPGDSAAVRTQRRPGAARA